MATRWCGLRHESVAASTPNRKPSARSYGGLSFAHGFDFDPGYGYSLEQLLAVEPPEAPPDFEAFWQARYERARRLTPHLELRELGQSAARRTLELRFVSTDDVVIKGWLTLPTNGAIERGFVVGHGYGGRSEPDALDFERSVFMYPCCRGLGASAQAPFSSDPAWHVLHDIDSRERYVLGGCVEDIWLSVSALLQMYPQIEGRIGYLGSSFGGGVGALAMAWDARLAKAHFKLPSFGHQALRLRLPTIGSASSVQGFAQQQPDVLERTLGYYDAASAARFIRVPAHVACALFDPAVAPPGQFAVFNALAGSKRLHVLEAGHFEYPARAEDELALIAELREFFADEAAP
jgi:cephalosporin-C deacetylase